MEFTKKQLGWMVKAVEERDREMERRKNDDMIDHPFLGRLTTEQWLEWRKRMNQAPASIGWKKEGF